MTDSLAINNLTKRFGGLVAVDDLSFSVNPGEVVALIGPNGSGKTTTLNCIAGALSPTKGKVALGGKHIAGKPPYAIAAAGVIRTFQAVNLFGQLSVMDHIILGSHLRHSVGFIQSLLPLPSNRRHDSALKERAYEILAEVGLQDDAALQAQGLSLGHQRRLSLAIGLAAEPHMFLLDEPLAGLSRQEQDSVLHVVRRLSERGLGILLVEHNMRAVMAVSDRLVVLHYGSKIAEGTPAEIQNDDRVQHVYLGTKRSSGAVP